MYSIYRLFTSFLGAEFAHHVTLKLLQITPGFFFKPPKSAPLDVMGLHFKHPVGLAAGFDKDGRYLKALVKLGFSFIELGTVTPRPQFGNPKPRVFRVPQKKALINRMGFNNDGVDALVERVQKTKFDGVLGISIGPNKNTEVDKVWQDYVYCLDRIYPLADYIAINISSPNTPGLRALQHMEHFTKLMHLLSEKRLELKVQHGRYVPIVIKVSPDETDDALRDMASYLIKVGLDGLILTNTTLARESLRDTGFERELGGLSGKPLAKRAMTCLKEVQKVAGDDLALIASGGVFNASEARARLDAGASLVQLYSGLIFEGPKLVSSITQT